MQIAGYIDSQRDRWINMQIDRQIVRNMYRKVARQIDRQIYRQTDKQMDKYVDIDIMIGIQLDRKQMNLNFLKYFFGSSEFNMKNLFFKKYILVLSLYFFLQIS